MGVQYCMHVWVHVWVYCMHVWVYCMHVWVYCTVCMCGCTVCMCGCTVMVILNVVCIIETWNAGCASSTMYALWSTECWAIMYCHSKPDVLVWFQVLVLQRLRYQEGMYNWFPLFCGGDEGIEKLRLHLTSSPLTNTVRFEQILDEDKTVSSSSPPTCSSSPPTCISYVTACCRH